MDKVANNKTGLMWKFGMNLEELEFADDICLIEETSQRLERKKQKLKHVAKKVGL